MSNHLQYIVRIGRVIHTQVKTVSTGFGSAIMKVELIKSKATQIHWVT